MKIRMTFEFDDHARRAVGHHYGEGGAPASRRTLMSFITSCVDGTMQDLTSEYDAREGTSPAEPEDTQEP